MPRLLASALTVIMLAAAGLASAEDTDATRFYFGGRLGGAFLLHREPAPGVKVQTSQQLTGFFAGVNLGKYLGVEVAGDLFETTLSKPGGENVSEYGMFSLVPQVRVRYPLLDGHLVPYAIAGVGMSHNEFNDRKPPGVGVRIRAQDTAVVAAVGAGVEYFVANNIALGVETKLLVSRDHDITVDDRGGRANLDAILTSANLRLFIPETGTPAGRFDAPWRPYLGFSAGGASVLRNDIASGLEMRHENASIGGKLDLLLGAALGLDIGRHLGVELAAEGYEPSIALRGVGTIREYAIYTFIPQLRVRYPLLDGRATPYLIAGVGASYGEANDAKPKGNDIKVESNDFSLVATVGAGVDYFVTSNIAFGLQTRYLYSRDHKITIDGRTQSLDLDSILTSAGVKIYFR